MKNNFFYNFSLGNINAKPSNNSETLSQILYGEKFKVLKNQKNWVKIKTNFDNYIGYIKKNYFYKNFKPTFKIKKTKSRIFIKKKNNKYRKATIPKAIREQTWLKTFGKKYESKCYISWCENVINVFDFHVGHNIPECKGGKLCLENVKPICSRCNHSMGSQYTITEWLDLDKNNRQTGCCTIC